MPIQEAISVHEPQPIIRRVEFSVPVEGGHVSVYVIDPTAEGTPIVWRHGGDGSSTWDLPEQHKMNQKFKKPHPLVFYDSLWSGNSGRPREGADLTILTPQRSVVEMDKVIKDVVIEELGREEVIVAGHSTGGGIAAMLEIEKQPKYTKALILMSPLISFGRVRDDIRELLRLVDPNNPNFQRDLLEYERIAVDDPTNPTYHHMMDIIYREMLLGMDPEELPPNLRAAWEASIPALNPAVMETTLGSYGELRGTHANFEIGHLLHMIKKPVLWIGGGKKDQNRGTIEEFAGKIKESEVVYIDDARHLMQYSHPEETNAAIVNFVNRVDAA